MKLALKQAVPVKYDRSQIQALFASIETLINLVVDGRISGWNLTGTAAPTGGTYQQGDFVRNSTPAEAGSAGSKYVTFGWICTASGTPGTFVEMRYLTGN